ncbi:uncharacterized protein A1O9_06165 [Exophiala aquamarina CBS 119918]|uniref:Uncharacterized protein n=1 Tax=Exophiala aquamarina CBS 119918 TaxID=1182545 RepID=A0A072PDT5_9EURO|nr:uncharacterized protein A1O9_06165 [Exophiala aquamarina CBS 119918]KEF58239.1 hypothetical protein A1O9_06165 [Exophiala aquamarina CBS 119918]
MATPDHLRIFAPIGQLGQSFSEQVLWRTLEAGADVIIADGGSTDSGPSRLALGKPNVPLNCLERDVKLFAKAAALFKVPVIIGSIGGNGENRFVDMCAEFVARAVMENGFRPLKVIKIYAEIDKDYVRRKMEEGAISPCGDGVPELTNDDINSSTRIVAQMGLEPFLKALNDHPDLDMIIAGRAYDPAPFAAYAMYRGFTNLEGIAYAMGKIMECGGMCGIPKTKEGMAILYRDSFDVAPCDPRARCTELGVASHFLYENRRPDILLGPGGVIHLDKATFEQIDDRTVKVRNSTFEPAKEGEYTVKLEGARVNGYQTIFLGAIRDPILLRQLDDFIAFLLAYVEDKYSHVKYEAKIHKYGVNGVMGPNEPDPTTSKEVFIAGAIRAPTQDEADQVASMLKFAFVHGPYKGQLNNAGNFAWPFNPSEIAMGPVSEFCIYHIMKGVDPVGLFPQVVYNIPGPNTYIREKRGYSIPSLYSGAYIYAVDSQVGIAKADAKRAVMLDADVPVRLSPDPPPGHCYLADLTSLLRSKNAGPYEMTLDAMFPNTEIYEKVKATGILNKKTIAKLYKVPEHKIVADLFFDQALAYKATIVRNTICGGFGETDTHGSQQHTPMMYLQLPIPRPF